MKDYEQLFEKAKTIDIPAPEFFEYRVLAHAQERSRLKKNLLVWKIWAFAATCSVLFLTLGQRLTRDSTISLGIGTPVVYELDLNTSSRAHAEFAEVVLPEGVRFHSEKTHGLQDLRQVRLRIESFRAKKTPLPVVLMAHQSGKKQVKVRFYSKNLELVEEKNVWFHFKERS